MSCEISLPSIHVPCLFDTFIHQPLITNPPHTHTHIHTIPLTQITTRFYFWPTLFIFLISLGGYVYVEGVEVQGMAIHVEGTATDWPMMSLSNPTTTHSFQLPQQHDVICSTIFLSLP